MWVDGGFATNPAAILVRYDEVVQRPDEQFPRICAFLGIRHEPRLIEGISAESVRRFPAANIDADIRRECDEMWNAI